MLNELKPKNNEGKRVPFPWSFHQLSYSTSNQAKQAGIEVCEVVLVKLRKQLTTSINCSLDSVARMVFNDVDHGSGILRIRKVRNGIHASVLQMFSNNPTLWVLYTFC